MVKSGNDLGKDQVPDNVDFRYYKYAIIIIPFCSCITTLKSNEYHTVPQV